MEGIINLHGGVIAVVDLRKRFGLVVTAATAQSRIAVMEIVGAIALGFLSVRRIARPVEALKSGSGSIGAMRVMESSERLQSLGRSGATAGAAELAESLDAALRDALTALAALRGDAAA